MDRDCKKCAYSSPNGCTAWDCEFIPREEAIAAWKEKHKNDDDISCDK